MYTDTANYYFVMYLRHPPFFALLGFQFPGVNLTLLSSAGVCQAGEEGDGEAVEGALMERELTMAKNVEDAELTEIAYAAT